VRGLAELEPQPDKQSKYLDFIDIYAALDDNELQQYRREYPEEAERMSTFAERFRQEGLEQGIEQGLQQGEAAVLLRLLERKFGTLPSEARQRIREADAETLLAWSERVLTACSLDEVVH
jgi:flagellar biosynthesis/type III secretory pathway protein FliH